MDQAAVDVHAEQVVEAAGRIDISFNAISYRVTLSSTASLEWRHQMGGFNVACAGIEALTRSLAGELGRYGVRVVGLRPNFAPETSPGVTADDVAQLVHDALLAGCRACTRSRLRRLRRFRCGRRDDRVPCSIFRAERCSADWLVDVQQTRQQWSRARTELE